VQILNPYQSHKSRQLLLSGVAVEKGTTAVILLHFGVSAQPTFNNTRRKFLAETPRKEFFISHRR
jgi:hypothetical protein